MSHDNGAFDARLRGALSVWQHDSEKLKDVMRQMDVIQLRIFTRWRQSDDCGPNLRAQLLKYDSDDVVYDYGKGEYRKPTYRELCPPGGEPRPKVLDASGILEELEKCIQTVSV